MDTIFTVKAPINGGTFTILATTTGRRPPVAIGVAGVVPVELRPVVVVEVHIRDLVGRLVAGGAEPREPVFFADPHP